MSGPQSIKSPNFSFLAKHNELLVRIGALAEQYVFTDPNTALFKLRQFAELLAKHTAAFTGLAIEERDTFHDVLVRLRNAGVISAQVSPLFFGLKSIGNDAAHSYLDDRREALHQLQMARKLAVWFHKSFSGDANFKAGSFVPPPNPAEANDELLFELKRLREAVATAEEEAAGAKASAGEYAESIEEAEAKAEQAYKELDVLSELGAESEQHLHDLLKQKETEIAKLQAQVAEGPAAVPKKAIKSAQKQSTDLDLDEAATRHIIDAQLREAGWEANTEQLRYSKGSRPVKGKNLAIAEWPTQSGPADYCLFVGLKPIGIVEAKKKAVDVNAGRKVQRS
jgi:type I restriction enzyme R subunit